MLLQSSFLLVLPLLALHVAAKGADCTSLLSLSLPNVIITYAAHLTAGINFTASADPTCFQPTYVNSADICRVAGTVNTSSTSSVSFEMWLPDTWYGRVLTGGNGGLGGCINYPTLDQGSFYHFATIAANGGHDGSFNGPAFLVPESLIDFSYRAVHVTAELGKKLSTIYYGCAPHHSYYNGCSAGGRQGLSVVSRYPDDFDGIIAGSSAVNWHHLIGAPAIWGSYVAANTSREIPLPLWPSIITPEILKQCDGIDGKVDGIIADPTLCSWNPDTLLCGPGSNQTSCLTKDQVDGLKKFYQPTLGSKGDIIVPAFEPGAEGDFTLPFPMNGVTPITVALWFNNAIYGQPTRPSDNFSIADLEYADFVDPAGISTWSNVVEGLGKYKNKGGKVLSYHGTRDPAIPSGNSKQFHGLLSSKLSHSDKKDLDEFYRLFMIPGMGHCGGGPGAWKIGQGALLGTLTDGLNQTDHNVLLSLVDWVEGKKTPEVIIGTDMTGQERKHCLWPSSKSVWDGTAWDCVPA